jgi:hypothetical protein
LVELLAAFDEPVARQPYQVALLALGQRTRTLFLGFIALNASTSPVAARALLRPMLEINILIRFLRKDPDLHTELWQAEGYRNTITIADEIREKPDLREAVGQDPIDPAELADRRQKVEAARKRALEAGLPVDRGAVLPPVSRQLQVINEPVADIIYALAYREHSWDIHAGPRAFLAGSCTERNDGTVSYSDSVSAEQLLLSRARASAMVASSMELIGQELDMEITTQAGTIAIAMVKPPPSGGEGAS